MINPFLTCICGARFCNYAAEARHRHNFPALCRQSRKAKNAVADQIKNSPFNGLTLQQINMGEE